MLWQLDAANAMGQITESTLGNGLKRISGYDAYYSPNQILLKNGNSVINQVDYNFNGTTGNLTSRSDIQCVDKKGNPFQLTNSPSLETRITYGHNNKKTIFYFDRIYVNSNSVRGVQSRFIESIGKSIPLDSITKIEIQDGRKKFKYIK